MVISTDTAFLLGALALVGPRLPDPLRVFLLTLAVADDIGALAIIALFYTDEVRSSPLLVAVACSSRSGPRPAAGVAGPAYVVVGAGAVGGAARVGRARDPRRGADRAC